MFGRKVNFVGFLLTLIASSCLSAAQGRPEMDEAEDKQEWTINGGVMFAASTSLLYSDRGAAEYSGFPFVTAEYKDFYWEGPELGYGFQIASRFRLTTFVQFIGGLELAGAPMDFEGKAIDADDLAAGYKGIGNRASQFEGGFKAEVNLSQKYMVELEGRVGERGSNGKILLQRNIMGRQGKWILAPFISGRILSSDYMDHFFSISSQQAADPRSYKVNAAYDASTVGSAGSVGFSGFYQLAERWSLMFILEGQTVSDEIKDSPIVRKREVLSGLMGAIYSF